MKAKTKKLIVFLILFVLVSILFCGCTQEESDSGTSDQTTDESSLSLDFIRKIEIAYGYYPGIIFTNNQLCTVPVFMNISLSPVEMLPLFPKSMVLRIELKGGSK